MSKELLIAEINECCSLFGREKLYSAGLRIYQIVKDFETDFVIDFETDVINCEDLEAVREAIKTIVDIHKKGVELEKTIVDARKSVCRNKRGTVETVSVISLEEHIGKLINCNIEAVGDTVGIIKTLLVDLTDDLERSDEQIKHIRDLWDTHPTMSRTGRNLNSAAIFVLREISKNINDTLSYCDAVIYT